MAAGAGTKTVAEVTEAMGAAAFLPTTTTRPAVAKSAVTAMVVATAMVEAAVAVVTTPTPPLAPTTPTLRGASLAAVTV